MFYRSNRRRVPWPSDGNVGELVTKQSHKAECDIHNILRQYQRTGVMSHVARIAPTFEDLPSDLDFQASMNMVLQAQDAFGQLPAKVREKFGNDPGRLLVALADPAQADALREVGLLKPLPVPASAEAGEGVSKG